MNGYIIEGQVVRGKQLGRTIGFPTANLDVKERIECAGGVYFALCEVDGEVYRVILNIGSHPTVPEGPPTVEAYLLDYSGNLYGRTLRLTLKRFMRGEVRFSSLDALRAQLEADRRAARELPTE